MNQIHRRDFLLASGALLAGTQILARPSIARANSNDASQLVVGKDKRLIIQEADPVSLETPVDLLGPGETPLDVLFVRNNQTLPNSATLKPLPLANWKIEVTGLVDKPAVIDTSKLQEMEQVEHLMVLQCSGNGRSLFARSVPAKGSQWTRGGMGNVRFGGVPLAKVIEKFQLRIDPRAKFLSAEGADAALPKTDDFEHSLPLDDVLSRSILALSANGKPLPAVHGGPVRLVTPGYYGTMQVKWLSRLRFEADESTSQHHMPRYRVPKSPIKAGAQFKPTFENSSANWRMKIKSVVFSPLPDARVAAGKPISIRGVAFNDGSARIESVLISVDRGQSWRPTNLQVPESLYAWYGWETNVSLSPGQQEIWVRAIDELGRTQPLDGTIHWNPSGYEWNGAEKIPLTVA